MPLPGAFSDDASPQNTNEWGDPTDTASDAPEDHFPQDQYHDSTADVDPSADSTLREPKQFKQLRPADQRFMKQVDNDTARLQLRGEIFGAAAGIIASTVLRVRLGAPLRPFTRDLGKTTSNYLALQGMDYFNGVLIGSIVGRLGFNKYGWESLDRKVSAEPAIAARIRTAMDAKENKEAFRKYRTAWYDAQQDLSIPNKIWYHFSYRSS